MVEAVTFGADDEDGGFGVGDGVIGLRAALVEAVDPVALLFELFEGLIEIADLDNGEVGKGAGGGFGGDFGDGGGAALGDDDAGGPGGVGGADDGAKVMRIFDAIEGDEHGGGGGEVRKGLVGVCGDNGDDPLMDGSAAKAVEGGAFLKADGEFTGAAEIDDLLQALASGAFGDVNAIDGLTGFESFENWMDAG
jgi:hypothetical protein